MLSGTLGPRLSHRAGLQGLRTTRHTKRKFLTAQQEAARHLRRRRVWKDCNHDWMANGGLTCIGCQRRQSLLDGLPLPLQQLKFFLLGCNPKLQRLQSGMVLSGADACVADRQEFDFATACSGVAERIGVAFAFSRKFVQNAHSSAIYGRSRASALLAARPSGS